MNKQILAGIFFTALCSPSLVFAYGEGGDIPEHARIIHLLTNEARTDPQKLLRDCGDKCEEKRSCYKPVPALYWADDLYRLAQFHANMISEAGCMMHDSPCVLVDTAAEDFPDKCSGSPACACIGGAAACKDGTGIWKRFGLFTSGGAKAENIASTRKEAVKTFRMWLYEKGGMKDKCGSGNGNGHRINLLSGRYHSIGVGVGRKMTVQDFTSSDGHRERLTSGAIYSDGDRIYLKTQYSGTTEADRVAVVVNGNRIGLPKILGDKKVGIYGKKWPEEETPIADCTPYHFETVDAEGIKERYPTTGSLLYNCVYSWIADEFNAPDEESGWLSEESDSCSAVPLSPAKRGMQGLLLVLLFFGCMILHRKYYMITGGN